MKSQLHLLFFFVALVGCVPNSKGDETSGDAEEQLYAELSAAYLPFQQCVAKKGPVGRLQYQEFVATGSLPSLEKDAARLLMVDDPLIVESSRPRVADAVRAGELLTALRQFGSDRPAPVRADYKAFDLRRKIAVDMALAPIPSIRCAVPADLVRLVRETDSLEMYLSLATAYMPFGRCTNGFLDSSPPPAMQLQSRIVDRQLLAGLRDDATRILGPEDRYVEMAGGIGVSEQKQAELLIAGLAVFSENEREEREYSLKARQVLAIATAKQAMASALDMNCPISKDLSNWMEFAKHANH